MPTMLDPNITAEDKEHGVQRIRDYAFLMHTYSHVSDQPEMDFLRRWAPRGGRARRAFPVRGHACLGVLVWAVGIGWAPGAGGSCGAYGSPEGPDTPHTPPLARDQPPLSFAGAPRQTPKTL